MKTKNHWFKKHLSVPGLLKLARQSFAKIPEPLKGPTPFPLSDCLSSALALFGLKYPSLLQFDTDARRNEVLKNNLQKLYGIAQVPCDTTMRERLDWVKPHALQKTIDRIIAKLQRAKVLEQYRYIEDYCLVAMDASGYFSSPEIHCNSCCEKHHRDGTVTYHHQILAAVMVHPAYPTVFPLALEPIEKKDGQFKNDCEHNAAKRLLLNLRRSHPHLKMIILVDALYADGPMLQLLKEHDLRFIITAKKGDLKFLFDAYSVSQKEEVKLLSQEGKEERYSYANTLPLNDVHDETKVNFLELSDKTGKQVKHFCWITNLKLNRDNVRQVSKGGRARWRIENETFNTLKNQGYQFEHNFGHGYQHLGTVFAYLMFTAFLIDQAQQFSCKYFKAALKKCGTRRYLWRKMTGLFLHYFLESWEQMFCAIIYGYRGKVVEILDSS